MLTGIFVFPNYDNSISVVDNFIEKVGLSTILESTESASKEDFVLADIYVELEIGRKRGENKNGEPCVCPGGCLGVCSIRIGISQSPEGSATTGFLDVDERLNVARIYFAGEVDFSDPEFLIDEDILVGFKRKLAGNLNGVVLEKGSYYAVPHEGNIRVDNMESRYKGYVDVNIKRF